MPAASFRTCTVMTNSQIALQFGLVVKCTRNTFCATVNRAAIVYNASIEDAACATNQMKQVVFNYSRLFSSNLTEPPELYLNY